MLPSAALALLLTVSSDPIADSYRSIVSQGGSPGLAWALVRDGKVIRHGEYGYADLENGVKVRRDTEFEIGSMTKQFTAAVMVLLAQEGKLSLDDPAGKYLPDLPEAWRPLTIRRLMSHTAGLKDYLGYYSVMDSRYFPPKEIVEKVGKEKLDFSPGTAWSYSNTGFLVATLVIEKIEGKPLADVLQKRLFGPLGMRHTRTSAPDQIIPHRAHGYLRGAKGWQNTISINPSLGSGAGYLVSTLDDLALWQRALQSGKIPTQELWQPVALNDGRLWNYGLGWMIEPIDGGTIVQHGGNTAGFSSHILLFPDRREALIALANSGGINPGMQSRYVAGLIDPRLSMEKRQRADPDPRQTLELAVMLRNWSRNRYDTSLIAPELRSSMDTMRGLALRQAFTGLGKNMKSLSYVDEDRFGADRWARYRVDMGPIDLYLVFRWNSDGKLVQLDQVYAH